MYAKSKKAEKYFESTVSYFDFMNVEFSNCQPPQAQSHNHQSPLTDGQPNTPSDFGCQNGKNEN